MMLFSNLSHVFLPPPCPTLRPLIAAMSEDQYDRHECYRRAGFNRANLRRLVNTHLGGGGTGASVNPTMTMAFGGVAKVFVGEIIEGGESSMKLLRHPSAV